MTTAGEVGETREDIPLKSGSKTSRLCSCDEDFIGGSKFINFAFATLSAIITVALLVQIYYGDYQVTPHGSVATDSRECSTVGTSVLKEGGNAIDAAIASAFCLAVVNPHTTGLDASGQILLYSHQTRLNPVAIDFTNISLKSSSLPQLVIGLAYIHQLYSKLPWKRLVLPAVNLSKKGFQVPQVLVTALHRYKAEKLFGPVEAGVKITLQDLGETLDNIANIPEDELYSYIPKQNIPSKGQSLILNFKYHNVYLPESSPSSLPLIENLQNIGNINFTSTDVIKPEYIYRLAEITQNTYDKFNITLKFYQGTSSNIAVIDLNDFYVSLVTGMYAPFGSRKKTPGGYLLDVKPVVVFSPSRLPIIITDKDYVCGRRIISGASDVATATQIIAALLIAEQNATSSIEAPRFNILPNESIGIEGSRVSFADDVIKYLTTLGKVVPISEPYSSCNIVEKTGDNLNSHSDSRGGGIASRF